MNQTPRLAAPFEAQYDRAQALEYTVRQLLRAVHTAIPVRVLAVEPGPNTGTVDVQPLVADTDTLGALIEQGPIFKVPFLRLAAGRSAVVIDPQPGDIGIAVFAERDISAVVETADEAAASTARRHSTADAMYLGGILNAEPTQVLRFDPEGGVEIVSTGDFTLTVAGDAQIDVGGDLRIKVGGGLELSAASTTVSGPVKFNDPIEAPEATVAGVAMSTHKHQVTAVGAPTGTPIP